MIDLYSAFWLRSSSKEAELNRFYNGIVWFDSQSNRYVTAEYSNEIVDVDVKICFEV